MGYSKEIYSQALDELEKRRLYSEQELEKRRQRLYTEYPRTRIIEQETARTSVLAAKAVLGGSDIRRVLTELKNKNLALQNELKDILEKKNLPANYLEQWYKCDNCKDTGYIDGKMCTCLKNLLRQKAYESLNEISPLALSDFSTFSLEYYPREASQIGAKSPYERMKRVYNYCKKYAENFSLNSRSMLFQGMPGLGKTHLSLAIAKGAIDKGYGVIYVSAPAILEKLENEHFGHDKENGNQTQKLLTECDLLILDDLGTEFASKYSVAAVYNIVNTRILSSKPIIISTNLVVKDLQEKYSPRMVSRMIGMLDRVEFIGSDIRQLKHRERSSNKNN